MKYPLQLIVVCALCIGVAAQTQKQTQTVCVQLQDANLEALVTQGLVQSTYLNVISNAKTERNCPKDVHLTLIGDKQEVDPLCLTRSCPLGNKARYYFRLVREDGVIIWAGDSGRERATVTAKHIVDGVARLKLLPAMPGISQ